MGRRENSVEMYFTDMIRETFGVQTRKIEKCNVSGFPDRIFPLPSGIWLAANQELHIPILVELKTFDGKLSPEQEREHPRLCEDGYIVTTVYGKIGVDRFIKDCKRFRETKVIFPEYR